MDNLDAATWNRCIKALVGKVYIRIKTLDGIVQPAFEEPDPAYVPLLAVFQELQVEVLHASPVDHRYSLTKVVSRLPYWQAAGNGEIEGALIKVLSTLQAQNRISDIIARLGDLLITLEDLLLDSGDTRQAALDAIKRWLEE